MRKLFLLTLALAAAALPAQAWGPEGHSIIAEIAQRRITHDAPAIMSKIESILGRGVSMASIASWADDYRAQNPATTRWHFVDIPTADNGYDPSKVCAASPEGDCLVAELDRLKHDVRCTTGDEQRNALMLAIHFVGDIHQPLHTVADNAGGNTIDVLVYMHGARCTTNCQITPTPTNLHAVWDSNLINMTVWDWGAYVTRLEQCWLMGPDAKAPGIDGGTAAEWAVETHKAAQEIWKLTPDNKVLDENYYTRVLPLLDRQLGLASLRLTRFLVDALGSDQCPAQ